MYCLDSHPVQRVCVEVVARLLPLWISLWLKTDLSNGKDVALLFSLTVTHLQNTNCSVLSTVLLLLAILDIHFIWLYLIFREMAVEHQGMFGSLLCHFNNKVGCWYNLRLQKGEKSLIRETLRLKTSVCHFISDEVAVDKRTSLVFSVKSLLYFFIHFLRTQLSDTLHLL